ncbi:MAG: TIGR02099 family protein [Pseudomonadota bacterium]|nr:TIGR02099 family protein [Pseudomonadota bacterium]
MVLRKVGKFLLYGCLGLLGLMLLSMLALKLALDRAPRYQAEIKSWIHGQIGYHVAFAHVSPVFRWYGPELYFERLELRSKDDRRVLARAAAGRVGADLWQLLRSGKLLAGRIELDSPDISITRMGEDEFALASEIALAGGSSTLPALRLAELPAGTLTIRRGLVTIHGWNRALPRLELRDVAVTVSRGRGIATLALAARLPPMLGGSIAVNGTARGFDSLQTLNWAAFTRAQNLSLAGWRQLLPQYLSRLGAGTGGFEAAIRGVGSDLSRADVDFRAAGVTAQLTQEPSVKFDQIGGALSLTHSGDRWTLLGRRVHALRAGRRDPDSAFDVSWRGSDTGLLEVRAGASYLRAETLLPLAGLLPQKELRERLQELAFTGEWNEARLNLLRDTADAPWRLDIRARFRGVGFAAVGRAPGLRGLSGTIAGTDAGGRIDVDAHGAVFTWPAELEQPIDLEMLKTTLYWKRTPEELLVATPSLELKNHDAALSGRVAWRRPADGTSPLLTMVTSVDNGNAAQLHRYLPRTLLAPSALAWLNRAFVAGRLSHADVLIQGPLRHFPFRDGTGLFLARAHMEGMTLDYREDWPRAEHLAVLAQFRNEGLTVQLLSGSVGNLAVDRGDARFVDFKTAQLRIHAAGSGDAADVLGYLRATPLDAMAEHAFSGVEAKGPMQCDVDLSLPFKQFDQRRILVHAHLRGVSLKRAGGDVAATELLGEVDVDGAQVARADVRGKLLGGAFQLQARAPRMRPVTRTTLVFNGTFGGDALRAALSLPPSMPIGGTSDWHAVLKVAPEPARERSLRITSSLVGVELGLPDPLAKPALRPLPSAVEIQWPASGGPHLRVTLGPALRGQFLVSTGTEGPALERGAVAFGASPSPDPPPFSDTQALEVGGTIERLDLGGWLKLYAPVRGPKRVSNFLRNAKVAVSRIDYFGLSFHEVSLDLASSEAGWSVGLNGPNVVGRIAVPGAESTEPWKLEFERLRFDSDSSPTDTDQQAGPGPTVGADFGGADPRRVPAIDFHAAETIWDERVLGDVQARLRKLDDGVGLERMAVRAANFTAEAKGEWRGKDAGGGRIEGTLTSNDVGATLRQLGYAAVIEAKTGKVDVALSWTGSPTVAALGSAAGHVEVALDRGQITGIDPGAGRVVGLASVAALPRRLGLDFSDLTDKGLAFDTVRGGFDLRDGNAYTDDVLLKGPAAEIGLIGRVGLKSKDYDQTAVVTGNVGSSLPLAAFAAGPVIGGAVLIFTQVFKQPLKGLARGYYRITGNWENPLIERIKSTDAAATAEVSK